MKTDDLIDMLAKGPVAVAAHATRRRYTAALLWGGGGAFLLMALGLGIRPDLAYAATLPLFWLKFVFALSLTLLGLVISSRLARPGAALKQWPLVLTVPVALVWIVAAVSLYNVVPDQRLPLLLGATWRVCTILITVLSIPTFIAIIWAMRGLAPTRLRLAGATAGLLSGSLAATVYCLHCTELEAPFIGTWYLLGILMPTVAGSLLGPRLLRW
jgi:hypothetical protein